MKKRRKIYYGVSRKKVVMIQIMILLLLFISIGYSLLEQSLFMNTNIEVAKLKVTVDTGQYLQHGTKRGTDCPAGSFCSGSTFSYNAEEDQGIVSCAVGSFSNAKSGTCTACQGKTTTDVGQSSCNSECSNKDGVDIWKNAIWNDNNSLSNLCTIQSCKAGYTKEGNTCGANTYHITLDNQDATTPGTTSIDVVYNAGIPSITVPTKRGYTFKGYYRIIQHEEPTPDEEILYIKADGTGAKNWDLISDATLVAKWEVITTTCEAGEYLPHDATSCSSCPEGSSCSGGNYSYHATEDQGSTLCPAGTYSTGGATTCSVCSGGASSEAGATSCNNSCSNAAHVKTWVNGCTISTCDTGYENKNNSCVARKFNVTLDNKSATTPGSTSVEVTYNAPVPSITVPAKTGYTFGGYYSEDNGNGTQYIKNDGTSAKDWDKTDLTKLYAKWTIISKTCSAGKYLPKGATSCSNCLAGSYCVGGTYSYKAGEDQGISKCAIGSYSGASASSCTACTGLTTSGVGKTSCDTDCTNKSNVSDWNPANWNNNNPTGLCSIKTCTVGYSLESNHCNASQYTITLDNQGATTPGSESVEVTYNEAVPNITVPVKTGYTFGGYYTAENGGGTQYIKADGTSAKNWNIPNETILFAKWTAKSVTVSAGQYLPKNSLTPTDCPAGSYCVGGTFDFNATTDQGINACAVGSYSASKKTVCTVCTNGKTTSGTGKSSCDIDCSNKTGASEWNTSSWNNNIPTGICSIKSCSTGYTLSSNKCNTNALVFDNQTISKDYNTSSQTVNVTPATNGTGTYTYTKKSGDADITLSSAGVITIPAGKAVGSYSVVITAKDSNSNVSKDATYTITINKVAATLTCSNKTYSGAEQTACSCSGGTVGGDYKATYYSATAYTASCTPDSNHTAPENKTWTMAKKAITITAKAQTVSYGTNISKTTSDVTVATLGSGDSLTAITLTPSTTNYTTNGTITPSAATIKKSSTDVTSNYSITYNTGVLKINKVAATLTCSNKTYNGAEQTACSCTGGTVGGDYKATNSSATAYTASCTPDSNHTAPDNVTWTMAKKAVTVTAASQSRAWNNSALTNSTCTAGSGQLVSGHAVTCTMTSASTITTAGSVDNEINTVTIKSGSTDVTSNYNVTKAKGTLTITEATPTVSLSAKTEAQRTYTGSAITANTATVSPNGGGAITYTYYTNSACSSGATTTAPTNVGTYYVKASVAAVTNKTKAASSSCVNHTIVKSNTTTSLSAITKTYNGSSQAASGASAKLSSNNATAPSAAFTYTYYSGDSCSGTALSGAPTNAGTYSVIATLTGTSNYNSSSSSCVKYTMNQKAITITAKAQTVNFGTDISKTTSDVTVATLGSGDSLTAITLTPSTTNYTTNGTITPSAAVIKKSSTDVTSNYSITYNTGVLKINKVAATLTCSNKTYNGAEQTACSCSGGTIGGDYKATNASDTAYTATCTGDGNHTNPSNKTWTMAKKAITITAKAQTVNYGTSISKTTSDVTVATLGTGDSLTAITLTPSTTSYTTNGTITPSAAVIKKSSTDVTSNYTITYKTGVLKINKVAATLTCSNKTYNGAEQTACSCSGGTIGGDYKATNYSATAYTATCTPDGNHTAPSDKTWTMAKKAITITAKDQTVNYGTAISKTTSDVTVATLGSGDSLSSITLAQSTTNYTTNGTITPSAAVIKKSSTDVTSNYTITYKTGVLKINKVAATLTCSNKTYNGAEQTACSCSGGTIGGDYKATNASDTAYTATCTGDGNHTNSSNKTWTMAKKAITITAKAQTVNYGTAISKTTRDVTVATLASGDSLSSITLAQSTTNYTANGTITPSAAVIKKSSTDVTSNYTITYKTGVLKINKVAATLTCSNKTYTGAEQTACSCTGGTIGGTYKATNASDDAYTATCTPDGNHTAPSDKTWTMAKKAITITAKAQTVNYGTSISKTTSDVTVATLGTGDSLTAITLTPSTTSYTTNGTITPSAATIKKSSTDVTSNYTITYKTGVLKINKVAATLTCSNKTYSGAEQTACSCSGGTIGGDYKATNASDTAYTATCTGDGNHTNPSNKTWTMAKKAVTVTAASQSRAWNNSALTNSTCTAGSGQLVSGHAVTCTMTSASTITTAGSVDNEINTVTIKSGSTDVTSNYNITKAKGTLTITEATPTVSLTAKTATYTGSAIAANTATVSPNSNPTITYTYYTNSDCSTKTGTTAATGAAASAGAAPKQVGQWYVKAGAAAVTNKTKAASSSCVSHKINQKKATITLTDSSKTLTFGTAGTNAYTYDGDGTVSCTSSDTSKVTCSVDTTNKKITVTPVAVTSSAVTITVKATAGTNYSAPDNKTFTVTVADGVAPTVTNIGGGTSLKATSQNLTLKCSDDVGVSAYYFGTTNPTSASDVTTTTAADLTSLTGSSGLTKNVTQEGTYYLACKDAAGNYAKKSIVIRKYQVQNVLETIAGTSNTTYTSANYATNGSAATYYVKDGTSLTLASIYSKPTGANAFKGFTTATPSTTAQTPSTTAPTVATNNTTVYYMWWTRLTYKVTVSKPTNGTIKAETVTQTGNSVTASTAAAELTVKYGDTVKATATPSSGYSFASWSGGYVSGTTTPVTGGTVTAAKTITGTFVDSTKPTCTITSSSNLKATSQTATLKCSDNIGVSSYYYGTSSSPAASDFVTTSADLTSLTGSSGLTKTISAAGTYYIFAKDAAGNISDAKSVVIRSYSVRNLLLKLDGTAGKYTTTNYAQASSTTYYVPNNTSLSIASIYTVPTGAAADTVKGYNLAAASTTAATLTATSTNVTLNGNKTISVWFDRSIYTITFDPNGGTNASCTSVTNPTKQIYAGQPIGDFPKMSVTKDGYYQGGWCSDSACTNIVTKDTIPTANTTYYLRWTTDVVWSDNVSYSHSGISCSDTQCVLDYLANQYKEKRKSINGN